MRGRKPTASALRKLHGNPSRLPRDTSEPRAVTGNLDAPPSWLSADQQLAWAYAIEHAPPGLLKRIDRGALTVWIVAEDLHRQAAIAKNASTLLVRTKAAGAAVNPLVAIITRQAAVMMKACGELGFSPVSRVRTKGDPQPEPFARGTAGARKDFVTLDDYIDSPPPLPPVH